MENMELKIYKALLKTEKISTLDLMRSNPELLDIPGYKVTEIIHKSVSEGYIEQIKGEKINLYLATQKCRDYIKKLESDKRQQEEAEAKLKDRKKKKTTAILIAITCVICAIFVGVALVNTVIIPTTKYNAAVELMQSGKYDEAIIAFEELNGYKDSVEQIKNCNEGIKEQAYINALTLMGDANYEEAIQIFESVLEYKDSADKIVECNTKIVENNYQTAVAVLKEGKIIQAYESFVSLGGYRDSTQMCDDLFGEYIAEKISKTSIGGSVFFGEYEQDNNLANGKERIEWVVLEKTAGKALVISKKILDCKQFDEKGNYKWESSTLRAWLNSDFMNTAFSNAEQAAFLKEIVKAEKHPDTSDMVDAGNDTRDKIFVLSYSETTEYFKSMQARVSLVTAFAESKGVENYSGQGQWWLRSVAGTYHSHGISHTYSDGSIYIGRYSGGGPKLSDVGVRPAIWIELD